MIAAASTALDGTPENDVLPHFVRKIPDAVVAHTRIDASLPTSRWCLDAQRSWGDQFHN